MGSSSEGIKLPCAFCARASSTSVFASRRWTKKRHGRAQTPFPWWQLLLVVLVVIAVVALLMWALTGDSLAEWLGRAAVIVIPVTLVGAVREQLQRRRQHG